MIVIKEIEEFAKELQEQLEAGAAVAEQMTEDLLKDLAEAEKPKAKSVYHKQCKHCGNDLDVYDVLDMFEVESHAIGHAIKKLLMAGKRRGDKDYKQDLEEAISSIAREL